jgi:hypothetical protein
MFNILIVAVILFIGLNSFTQEIDLGVKAGYTNVREATCAMGTQVSENASAFYVGFLSDFRLNVKWHVQPSINYFNAEKIDLLY